MRLPEVRSTARAAAVIFSATVALLASGCGKSPTAPDTSEIRDDLIDVTIDISSVLCVRDGDPRPHGGGRFTFRGSATHDATVRTFGTPQGEAPLPLIRLQDGDLHPLDWNSRFRATTGPTETVVYDFFVTRWIDNGSDALVPDPTFNGAGFRATVAAGNFNFGDLNITLAGSTTQVQCRTHIGSKSHGTQRPATTAAIRAGIRVESLTPGVTAELK